MQVRVGDKVVIKDRGGCEDVGTVWSISPHRVLECKYEVELDCSDEIVYVGDKDIVRVLS